MLDTSKINILNEEITLPSLARDRAEALISKFSAQVSHCYNSRTNNGATIAGSETRRDIAVGKWGEFFAAYGLYKHHEFPILIPDTTIYDASHKSWEHDLPYAQKDAAFPNIAVKTCNQYIWDHYGLSWILQYNNPKDDLFKHNDPNVIIACMVIPDCDPAPDTGILVATVPWGKVKLDSAQKGEIKLGDPVSRKFHGLKKCIYYDDLVKVVEDA